MVCISVTILYTVLCCEVIQQVIILLFFFVYFRLADLIMLGMYSTLLFDPLSSLAVLLNHLSLIVTGHSNNLFFIY